MSGFGGIDRLIPDLKLLALSVASVLCAVGAAVFLVVVA